MSQRGRGRDRGSRQAGQPAPTPVTSESLLEEAETLQQRAERRNGQEALQAFNAAASKYREALAAGLSPGSRAEAHFGLGECLQLWGDGQVQLLQHAPDAQLALQGHQQQITAAAAEAYQSSVEAYHQVGCQGEPRQLRTDAAVNAANALSSLAELVLVQGGQRQQLLQQAVVLYRSALQQEEDALTLSNCADALVALGEAALSARDAAGGQSSFQAAVEAYQASCSLSDSSAGDDLPGLLHNWGVGMHTISKHTQDAQLKQSLLQQAVDKLKASMQFGRADPDPANALGDCLMDAAELLVQMHGSSSGASVQAAGSGSVFAGPGVLPPDVAAQAGALIKQAADDGYMAALTINRTNADALVGLAEANVAMSKLACRQGDQEGATAHIHAAVGHYRAALTRPQLLGSAEERADCRYNAACAAALAGPAHFEMAQLLLQALAAAGHLKAADAAADDDLAVLRGLPWFQSLLAGLPQ